MCTEHVLFFVSNSLTVPIIPNFLHQRHHPVGEFKNTTPPTDITSWTSSGCRSDRDMISDVPSTFSYRFRAAESHISCSYSNTVNTTQVADSELRNVSSDNRHQNILDDNIYVGLMFGSKAILQLIASLFVGPITNRFVMLHIVNIRFHIQLFTLWF